MSIAAAAFLSLATQCAPNVDPDTLSRIVQTESSFQPYVIAVVEPPQSIRPASLDDAVKKVEELEALGRNYSIGLGGINKSNFGGLSARAVFEPCQNLKISQSVISTCYDRALKTTDNHQSALLKSFSCYYSNNFTRGFVTEKTDGKSYVQRIVAAKVPKLESDTQQDDVSSIIKGKDDKSSNQRKKEGRTTYESWDVLKQFPVVQDEDEGKTAMNKIAQ